MAVQMAVCRHLAGDELFGELLQTAEKLRVHARLAVCPASVYLLQHGRLLQQLLLQHLELLQLHLLQVRL